MRCSVRARRAGAERVRCRALRWRTRSALPRGARIARHHACSAERLLGCRARAEGDRKAYYETSQWTIKQNRETLAATKVRARPGLRHGPAPERRR
jgi:hypothetical protein